MNTSPSLSLFQTYTQLFLADTLALTHTRTFLSLSLSSHAHLLSLSHLHLQSLKFLPLSLLTLDNPLELFFHLGRVPFHWFVLHHLLTDTWKKLTVPKMILTVGDFPSSHHDTHHVKNNSCCGSLNIGEFWHFMNAMITKNAHCCVIIPFSSWKQKSQKKLLCRKCAQDIFYKFIKHFIANN